MQCFSALCGNRKNKDPPGSNQQQIPLQQSGVNQRPPANNPPMEIQHPKPDNGGDRIESVQLLGDVSSTNCPGHVRDLGFSGSIGNVHLNMYGDTLVCGNNTDQARINMVNPLIVSANSAAYGTNDPTKITDFNVSRDGHVRQFCGYFPEEQPNHDYGMGITNVIQEPGSSTTGIIYFLKNYRKGGINRIVGAGPAVVDVSGKHPTCTRLAQTWWDANWEPWYGDHSQLLADDGYVYVYGGIDDTKFDAGMYLCRVRHGQQRDLNAYEYWNGTAFTPERIINPTKKAAVTGANSTQGMVIWSPYLKCYLYIHSIFNYIVAKTAPRPEGPWSEKHFDIWSAAKFPFLYAPSAQPRFDPSGKTLIVSYTAHPNTIQAIKITFK